MSTVQGLKALFGGAVTAFVIAAWPGAEGFDAQLVHHVLMVLRCRPIRRRQWLSCGYLTNEDGQGGERGNFRQGLLRVRSKNHV